MPAGRSSALGGAFDLALAKAVPTIPEGPGLQWEPKFDGFRAVAVVQDGRVRIFSRNGTDLTARLPELEQAIALLVPEGTVIDGEAVVWASGRLDFDALQRRMGAGPALARRMASEHPASFVAFDVLAVLGRDVRQLPLSDRRRLLEELATGFTPPMQISLATRDRAVALPVVGRLRPRGAWKASSRSEWTNHTSQGSARGSRRRGARPLTPSLAQWSAAGRGLSSSSSVGSTPKAASGSRAAPDRSGPPRGLTRWTLVPHEPTERRGEFPWSLVEDDWCVPEPANEEAGRLF